jgi:hypothetical protein
MDILRNTQNSYNKYKYSTQNKKHNIPLLTSYDNKDYQFKKFDQNISNKFLEEKQKWDKDYTKFDISKFIKNKDASANEDVPKKEFITFAVITIFATGIGIYVFRRSIFR